MKWIPAFPTEPGQGAGMTHKGEKKNESKIVELKLRKNNPLTPFDKGE
jgi:hypothetical protein